MLSRPSRARGLKHEQAVLLCEPAIVAPLAGAWIETIPYHSYAHDEQVAPLAGAWIETGRLYDFCP